MRKELARRKEAAAAKSAKEGSVPASASTPLSVSEASPPSNPMDEFVSILSGKHANNKKQGKK